MFKVINVLDILLSKFQNASCKEFHMTPLSGIACEKTRALIPNANSVPCQSNMKDEDYYPLLDKIVSYCGYSERCFQDVDKRMYKLRLDADIKDRIIDYLVEHDVVNEKRFAFSFALGKLRYNRWGRIKIRAYLKAKRIGNTEVQFAFDELDETEYNDTLEHVVYMHYQKVSEDRFAKTVRHAQSRGFELSLILETFNRMKTEGVFEEE